MKKAVNNLTNTGGISSRVVTHGKMVTYCLNSVIKSRRSALSLLSFSLSISFPCFCCSTLCERSSLCTPSLLLLFSFLSLCSFALCSLSPPLALSLSPPLPSPCTLWYADMQEFLGLKMIDQTCQPWLLLLKMAAPAVCVPMIGACLSYSLCDWS